MKKHFFLSIALMGLVSVSLVEAKERKTTQKDNTPVVTSSAAPSRSSHSASSGGETEIGIGYTTLAETGSPSGAASIWIDLNEKQSIQGILGFGTSSPFAFSVGGFYRMSVLGSRAAGFHVGGGIDLGTAAASAASISTSITAAVSGASTSTSGSAFFINIRPLAGFHFQLPNLDHVAFSIDGGPTFAINDGNFQFSMGPGGSLLGLSVHYMF